MPLGYLTRSMHSDLGSSELTNIGQNMLDVKLVVIGGATESDEFRLKLPAVFGRSRDASIPLPHPLVSRRHCELFERHGQLLVRDLGSTNGTFVGSERVTEAVLRHGQLLTIGTVTFRAVFAEWADHLEPTTPSEDRATFDQGDTPPTAEPETSTILRTDTGHVGGVRKPYTASHEAKS